MDFVEVVSTLGFPIACVIALAVFMAKFISEVNDRNKEREEKLYSLVYQSQDSIEKAVETNAKFIEQLEKMQNKIDVIENDVKYIKETIE